MEAVLDAAERGKELEERVAAHFGAHGYLVQRNLMVEGRSGARHEVDVLAEKADSLTTYRVAVECKAWRIPVGQEVVSKLAWVMSDLGVSKGIVVSLAGAEPGAVRAAEDLGIELWGAGHGFPGGVADLDSLRLPGRAPVPGGDRGPLVLGPPVQAGPQLARRVVNRARVGRLGPGAEVVVTSALVWVPVHELGLALTRSHGRVRPRRAVTCCWNRYEGLAGALLVADAAPQAFSAQPSGGRALPCLVRGTRLAGDIRRAMDRLAGAATEATAARHAAALAAMGVDGSVEHVEVEQARLVHLPFHLALLRRGQARRMVAVDGCSGRLSPVIGAAATVALSHVVDALGWPS